MTPVWIAFWAGMFLGASLCVLIIGCCVVARHADDVLINCYAIDQDPAPAIYIMPDEKVAKRIARRSRKPQR